jgi:DNA polymerase III subunit alpha
MCGGVGCVVSVIAGGTFNDGVGVNFVEGWCVVNKVVYCKGSQTSPKRLAFFSSAFSASNAVYASRRAVSVSVPAEVFMSVLSVAKPDRCAEIPARKVRKRVCVVTPPRGSSSCGIVNESNRETPSLKRVRFFYCSQKGRVVSDNSNFVHLHNHSDFSTLDGLSSPAKLLAEAERLKQPAFAVTDHGNMAGAWDLFKASSGFAVKPIYGIEAYFTPGAFPRTHRGPVRFSSDVSKMSDDVSGNGAYTHMTLWAETNEGLRNLFKLTSESFANGVYRKPRADKELLAALSGGVIGSTGCPSGEVQTLLRLGMVKEAHAAAGELSDILGKGNLYVELMDHGLRIETVVRAGLLQLAKELNLPLVATNDLHYATKDDAHIHDALLCVGTAAKLEDGKRFRFNSELYYVRPANEMRELFKEHPDACDNTLLIAERCNATFPSNGMNLMPRFPVPDGYTEISWLETEVNKGLRERFKNNIPPDRVERAKYELGVITEMGFPGYFLVVADFINWAKREGIRVGPGRGSAAGSIVSYALGITDLDPVRHELLFERFLNPERVSMPDIDIDFDEKRRHEVITYVTHKWGEEYISQIGTFGRMKAKTSIKDAARVMGLPYSSGEKLTKLVPPPAAGKDVSLANIYNPDHERYKEGEDFRRTAAGEPALVSCVELAKGMEGSLRSFGMHAAGIIMSNEPIINHVPLMRIDADKPLITQFEYPSCEKLGLLKMDFLGLSNLTTIDEAIKLIQRDGTAIIDLDEIGDKLNDPAAFQLLQRGDTLGVFQLDSTPIRALLRSLRPDTFNDISAVLALYRPGPMAANAHNEYADRKNGRKPIEPIHEELTVPLAGILNDTYGLCIFQEQVQQIAQKVANYSLGKADLLRRAMGKKDKTVLDKEYEPFSAGMKANGYSEDAIKKLWDILVPFSDYAFNRSHTAAYGMISYWTAYLKANYPTEYMAALLTTNADDKDKTATYLAECRRMNIKILPPDVNESGTGYTAIGGNIRVGLLAIRNLSESTALEWLKVRDTDGPAVTFSDFLTRAPMLLIRKRVVDSMIAAGAFDSFGYTRNALTSTTEKATQAAAAARKQAAAADQDDLFGNTIPMSTFVTVPVPDLPEWRRQELCQREKDTIGLYISDHPLNDYLDILSNFAGIPIKMVKQTTEQQLNVTILGLVTNISARVSKRTGQPWATLTVEDFEQDIEINVFAQKWSEYGQKVHPDTLVEITGKIDTRDGDVTFIANTIRVIDPVTERALIAVNKFKATPVMLHIPERNLTETMVMAVKNLLRDYAGVKPVHIKVTKTNGTEVVLEVTSDLWVTPSDKFITAGEKLIGIGKVEIPGWF